MGKASTMKKLRHIALDEMENETPTCENCGSDGIYRKGIGVLCDPCFIQMYPDELDECDSFADEIVTVFLEAFRKGSPLFTRGGVVRPNSETELKKLLYNFINKEEHT
jgi:hypothetical protein